MRPVRYSMLLLAMTATALAADPAPVPVGLYGELRDLVLPGTELEAKALTQEMPVVLRVVAARPHGDAFRYDLDYYGLEAGEFDLRDFLQRKDGSPSANLPPLPVRFTGQLAPSRLTPNEPEAAELPKVGGYRTTLIVAGIVWLFVLLLLLFVRRRRPGDLEAEAAEPLSVADRLRPLVEAARDGALSGSQQAELERALIGFWREKLELGEESPATALAKLKEHGEAAPLIQQLEHWLHSPEAEPPADLEALLRPYRST